MSEMKPVYNPNVIEKDITLSESISDFSLNPSEALGFKIASVTEASFMRFILASTKYKRAYGIKLRPYQLKFGLDIIDSVMNGRGNEIVGLFSRQSGKTETVAAVAYFLATISHMTDRFKDGIRIGIFGPKKEQSDIAFNRLLSFFDDGFSHDILGVRIITRNSTMIKLSNGSVIKSLTASKNATIEGETMDLIFVEEAQDVSDIRLLKSIFPMLSSTNGTRVLTGTPTPEHSGYFYYASTKRSPHTHKITWQTVAQFSEKYHRFIIKEMKKHGSGSDWFVTQYEVEWLSASSNFVTQEKLFKLANPNKERIYSTDEFVYIGIDPAKLADPTVITVCDANGNIINWLEMIGDNYNEQLSTIQQFISQYPNSVIGIDTLGPGEVLYDLISQFHTQIYRYPMSNQQKSEMFILLKEKIDNESIWYPGASESVERSRFEEQMIELEAKWNGNILQVHGPQSRNKHDDYPASLAICTRMVYDFSEPADISISVGKRSNHSERNSYISRKRLPSRNPYAID